MHSPAIVVRCFQENNGASGAGFQPAAASRGMRPRSSPVRTWQSLRGRDASGSAVRGTQPSSDAEKAGAVLSHRARGEAPEPSTAPGLPWLGAPEPWSSAAGPCGRPCAGTGSCRVQHCGALPALTPFSPPFVLVGIFPAVTASPLGSLSAHPQPLLLAAAPRVAHGGPPLSPWPWDEILHPGAVKGQSCLPGAFQPNRTFGFPAGNMPCHTVPCQANAPAASTGLAAEGFRQQPGASPFCPHT